MPKVRDFADSEAKGVMVQGFVSKRVESGGESRGERGPEGRER